LGFDEGAAVVAPVVSAVSRNGIAVPYISTTDGGPDCANAVPDARAAATAAARRRLFIFFLPGSGLLAGVFHVGKLVELDVVVLAAHLLDTANVHRLHDIAGLGVDGDGAARARELEALQCLHRLVAVDVPGAGLLHHL